MRTILLHSFVAAVLGLVLVTNTGCPELVDFSGLEDLFGGAGTGGDTGSTGGIADTGGTGGTADTDSGGDDGMGDTGGGTTVLTIVRTNQPVHVGAALHASPQGGIIAFDFRDSDGNLTVGVWDIDAAQANTSVRVTGFNNTAGVSDPTKPRSGDFKCLGGKILVTDGKTIGLYDTATKSGQTLTLPGQPGEFKYVTGTGVAGDGGRYGAAILENTGEVDFQSSGFNKLVAIDGETDTVIEFTSQAAQATIREMDFYRVAVSGSKVALLRDDLDDGDLFANTITIFDILPPAADPVVFVFTTNVSTEVLEYDGKNVLIYTSDEDRIAIWNTDDNSVTTFDPPVSGNIGQLGHEQFNESLNNGLVGYTTTAGDGFGATSQAASGLVSVGTATRVGDMDAIGHSPAGFGNSVAVTANGRVFSAGERDISTQGGNLSEVAGGSAAFISDAVGDAAADGFIAASDIGAVGNLVFFKTGLDGNNNASLDTVLSYFFVAP